MAQKVNPIAVRLHRNRFSDSSWFSDYYYAKLLHQDLHIRNYLDSIRQPSGNKLGFRPARCVIHHYPKRSVLHLFCLGRARKHSRYNTSLHDNNYSYEHLIPHSTQSRQDSLADAARAPREIAKIERRVFGIGPARTALKASPLSRPARQTRLSLTTHDPARDDALVTRVHFERHTPHNPVSTQVAVLSKAASARSHVFWPGRRGDMAQTYLTHLFCLCAWPSAAFKAVQKVNAHTSKYHLQVAWQQWQELKPQAKHSYGDLVNIANEIGIAPDKMTLFTNSSLNYIVMLYWLKHKTNGDLDINWTCQNMESYPKVIKDKYWQMCLSKSRHYYLTHIQALLSSHTNTLVSLVPVKVTSVYQSAALVAQEIACKLEHTRSFRQICKTIFKHIDKCKYIKGIRIACSGRLNGAEIAKTECKKYGETSLHVFSDQIDYAYTRAATPYGILGVKVWISYL